MNRYFRSEGSNDSWQWRKGTMYNWHGEDSIFGTPEDLIAAMDVYETDENGHRLEDSREDIEANKADHDRKCDQYF